MIELNIEDELLAVPEAIGKVLAKVPSAVTIWRWRNHGVNDVKLPAKLCGRKWMTTVNGVREFIRLQNEGT